MEKVLRYIDEGKDRFLEELKDFLRIPSISNNTENKKDVLRCAHYVADQLRLIGMQQTQLFPTSRTPHSLRRMAGRSWSADGPLLWTLRCPTCGST